MVTGVRDEGASQHHGQIMDSSLGGLLSEGFNNFGVDMGSLGSLEKARLAHLHFVICKFLGARVRQLRILACMGLASACRAEGSENPLHHASIIHFYFAGSRR